MNIYNQSRATRRLSAPEGEPRGEGAPDRYSQSLISIGSKVQCVEEPQQEKKSLELFFFNYKLVLD